MQKTQRFVADQRLDLPQYESMMALISAEFQAYNKAFISPTNLVVKGWAIESAGGLTVRVNTGSDSLLFNSERVGFELIQYRAAGMAALQVSLQDNSTNYVEVEMSEVTTGNDSVAIWDSTANSGLGAEFIQNSDTVTCEEATLIANTISFSVGQPQRLPLAIVVTSGGAVVSVTPAVNYYYHLATDWSFGSPRTDTTIGSMKSNDDALKTCIKEMKGTTNWFDNQGITPLNLLERFNYLFTDGGLISWNMPKGATGSLTAVASDPNTSIKNSDTLTISDGTTAVTFVFKTDGSTPAYVITVPVNGTPSQVKAAIISAVNAAGFNVTASAGSGNRIVLTNSVAGTAGNVTVTQSISNSATLSPTGMMGGLSASALTWSADLHIVAPGRAFAYTITAQSIAPADGQVAYVTLPAEGTTPGGPLAVTLVASSSYLIDPLHTRNYIIAYCSGSQVYFGNGWQSMEINDGEQVKLGDGVPTEMLAALGLPNEFTSIPPWQSNYWVTPTADMTTAIGELDQIAEAVWNMVTGKVYDETLVSDGSGTYAANAFVTLPAPFGVGAAQTYQTGYHQLEVFFNGRKAQLGAGNDWLESANVGAGIGNQIQLLVPLPNTVKLTFRIQTGGGQTGSVATASPNIYDEGSLVVSLAGVINFQGAAVTVSQPSANQANVKIQYPRELAKLHKNGTVASIPAFTVVAWQDDGTVAPAEANISSLTDLAGITAGIIAVGQFGTVIKLGNVPGALASLGAVPGAPVYLSDTAGVLSLTPPPGLTDALIRLGRAEPADGVASATANDLWLQPEILAGA